MRSAQLRAVAALVMAAFQACRNSDLYSSARAAELRAQGSVDATSYEGVDRLGIPNYDVSKKFTPEETAILRRAYGIEDPHRLYVSDSTEEGLLKYDTKVKQCLTCYVNSYRVGFVSVRLPGESWEQAESRVRHSPRAYAPGSRVLVASLDDLDPEVIPVARAMLASARRAGFRYHVTATYRSPLREAYLMAKVTGLTHTLTSNHSYGRALDIVIDDGNLKRPATSQDWIAFRNWVIRYRTGTALSFRILGTPAHTWDWPHVELPSPDIGFKTIEGAIARGRACLVPGATILCNFQPHLPARLKHAMVQ
ncbi:MAG: M15 family metallopeptidase [Gemmatimonadaceae bacterium]